MLDKIDYQLLATHFPAWDKLSAKQQELLCQNATLLNAPKNSSLNTSIEGCSGVLIIKAGTLRAYTLSEEGKEITFYRLQTGDICLLSASCVLPNITLDIFIETLSDCDLIQIPPCIFAKIMRENIYLENITYKLSTKRLCAVICAMQQMMFTSFDKRLASFLLTETTHNNEIAMTHEQIAKLLGTAREVVSRMLKSFARKNYVKLTRGKVTILNQQALKQILHKRS